MHITSTSAYFTPEEMAATLRISIRKLQKMMKEGTAPKHIKVGTKVLFPVEKGEQQ